MSWEMPSEIQRNVPAWPKVHRRLPDGSLFGNDQKHGLNNSIVTVAVNNTGKVPRFRAEYESGSVQ